ncbi:MAG: DNA/RNA-binding protein [Candidatus Aramenus sulfurataquae]|jgi:DNA-binding protein Alba|uniref:DNA-binding protein n=2 Tax=Candidatus Aramenus sulfurataquae TaxID=1326980 RepID=W7KUZ9_9CREN|nr:MAG: DNA/RNA-binding protein [Candidatus Aramenus sulfurataquae]MBW9140394.1 DNA-binding protein [Candidatus Aramenus sp.]MCL7344096.1 DNA-binding protein [Candidatus Aramenus sulfurataquae]
MADKTQIVITSSKTVDEHVLEILSMFNQGVNEVELKGYGREINKLVDVYNQLKDKLGEGVKLENAQTGSEVREKRRISYLLIRLSKAY